MNNLNNILNLDKIYVINLERDREKKELMIKKLKKYNINAEFVKAVDGKNPEIYKEYIKNKKSINIFGLHGLYRTPGAYGCLLSHIKVLEDAINNNYNQICILQDDIIFHNNFYSELNIKLKIIPDYDILYLGSTQLNINWNYNNNYYYVNKNNDVRGFHSVVLKKVIFNKLLNSFKLLKYSADICLRNLNCKKVVINPSLVIQDRTNSTTSNYNFHKLFLIDRIRVFYYLYVYNWKLSDYDLEYLHYSSYYNNSNYIDIIAYILYMVIYYIKFIY